MLEKLKLVEARYLEMAERAAQPDFYNDPKAASQLLKEQRQLEPIITAYRSYMKTTQEQDDLRAMLSEGLDPEMKALCQEEFSANKKKLEELEQELKILLLPRDPNDDKSVIMEIRGGVGGEESALFAHSLYRMYTMYAESKRWTVTLLNYNETELGGIKEADFEIQGAGAYSTSWSTRRNSSASGPLKLSATWRKHCSTGDPAAIATPSSSMASGNPASMAARRAWRFDRRYSRKPPQPPSPAPQTTKTNTAGVARNAMHAATAMTTQPETETKHTQRQVSGSKAMPAHRSRSLDRSRSLIESGAKPASASTARDHKRAAPA